METYMKIKALGVPKVKTSKLKLRRQIKPNKLTYSLAIENNPGHAQTQRNQKPISKVFSIANMIFDLEKFLARF